MSEERWFKVAAYVQVRAEGRQAAINRVAHPLRDAKVKGLYPVGTFDAVECPDPVEEARRRNQPEPTGEGPSSTPGPEKEKRAPPNPVLPQEQTK